MNPSRLRGQTAVITGATSGIGRETAIRLSNLGMKLAVCGRNVESLRELESNITGGTPSLLARSVDVADKAQVDRFAAEVIQEVGIPYVLVVSAGQYIRGHAATRSHSDFERAMAVNFYGALNAIYAFLPHMLKQNKGHIVVVSSVDGKKGLPLDAPYVASKFAITGFLDVLRQELHGTSVRVTTILPGRVDTPMIANLKVPWTSRKIAAGRVASSIVRALGRRGGEVIVPWWGPKTLVIVQGFNARVADWLVRLFHLEGKSDGQ